MNKSIALFYGLFGLLFCICCKADENAILQHNSDLSDWIEHARDNFADIFKIEIDTLLRQPLDEYVTPSMTVRRTRQKKKFTIITYMAADNDLAPFARKNLKQQTDIGSSAWANIVVQLDTRIAGNKKVTKRYYVEKNKLTVTNAHDPKTQQMDSGAPETLIDCCKWAIQSYPAESYILILWNHGTGALDIGPKRIINPLPLFNYNPHKNIIELDRSISFLDYVQSYERAICFDDSTGHCLSNQDLIFALDTVKKQYLGGKKFKLVCFDACLMSMVEVADIMKDFAEYMTASQEVVLGPGYNYQKMLTPFLHSAPDSADYAKYIVHSFGQVYSTITNDYTQSAIHLASVQNLENSLNDLALHLMSALQKQQGSSVFDIIRLSRSKLFCTHFDERSYIDIHHFASNLLERIDTSLFVSAPEGQVIIAAIKQAIGRVLQEINHTVLANTAGKNLAKACGLSIYFPERKLHLAYQKTPFAQKNNWFNFIKLYLSLAA
ncbi:MAG: clostripain-related cysteine peptidase [Candidatus Babeliales bacterium]